MGFTRSQWKLILQALGLLLDSTDDALLYVRVKEIESRIRKRLDS